MKEIINNIIDNLDNEYINTLNELYDLHLAEGLTELEQPEFIYSVIGSLLEKINYEPTDKLTEFENRGYYESLHEWADSQVEYRYYYIYKATHIFADYTDSAVQNDEYIVNEINARDFSLVKLLQAGEYQFWYDLGNQALGILEPTN